MFTTQQLAAAIDGAEGRLCRGIARLAASSAHGHAVKVFEIGGGVAVFTQPGSPVNKLIGAGFDGPLEPAALQAAEDWFASQGARLQAEVSTLATPAVHAMLTARGYEPTGFENVLGHDLSAVPAAPADVEVSHVGPANRSALAETMVAAFSSLDAGGVGGDEIPAVDEMRRWLDTMTRLDGFRGYVARLEGRIVGGGSLRVDGEIAQFIGAGTLPAYRRRGVQTALLRARLADAASAGCSVAVIVTQPASKSQQNAQREGFALLCARQLLVKPPSAVRA